MNQQENVIDLLNVESEHHILSPSSADRWMVCPGSVKASIGVEDTTSDAAEEGRVAHDWAEKVLTGKAEIAEVAEYDADMGHYIATYVDYIRDLAEGGRLWVEQRLDIGEYITGCEGTSDAIVYSYEEQALDIADLKYGTGVKVFAYRNRQASIYTLGVLSAFRKAGIPVKKIRLHIHQPRLDHVDTWDVSPEEIEEFGEEVRIAAQRCIEPDPEFNPDDKACQWCKVQATCPALREHAVALLRDDFEPLPAEELTDDQIRMVLEKKGLIEKWLRAVEASVFDRIERGEKFPGFKMVAGRSQRRWKPGAEDKVQQILGDAAFERKLKNLTQIEKELGKKQFAELDLTIKPPGKPTMVVDSDPRPALTSSDPAGDFENLNEEE